MKLAKLQEFRQAAYKHLGKAHDATFELTDAILTTRNAYSERRFILIAIFSPQVAKYLRGATR